MASIARPSYPVILEETFAIVVSKQIATECKITLHQRGLYIEPQIASNANEPVKTIKVNDCDIIGCDVFEDFQQLIGGKKKSVVCIPAKNKRGKVEVETNDHPPEDVADKSVYFCVYSYPLKTRLRGLGRAKVRQPRFYKVRVDKYESKEENFDLTNKWQNAIQWISRGVTSIPPSPPNPRKLLIFVNPCSGPGKALEIFKEQVKPILSQSGTLYDLIITDRINRAREHVRCHDISTWDGIVIVSGDGLLYEVINGLMERPDWENAIKVPLGVVPGGSGNGLAMALSYALGDAFEGDVIVPAALNIVKGRLTPLDLVKVETPTQCLYSFLSIGWGLIADIDIESERLRSIGGARFTVWAIVRAIGLRQYHGKLSYLPIKGYVPASKSLLKPTPKMKRSKTLSPTEPCPPEFTRSLSHFDPLDARRRSSANGVVELAFEASQVLECFDINHDLKQNSQNVDSPYRRLNQENLFAKCTDEAVQKIKRNSTDAIIEDLDLLNCNSDLSDKSHSEAEAVPIPLKKEAATATSCATDLPPLKKPVPNDWVVEEGQYVLVYVSHVSHISTDCIFAPDAKLDDGLMWLVVIRAGVTRAQVLQFLLALDDGSHVKIPFVDVIPVTAFRLEPLSKEGYLTVDGESIDCTPIQACVMPSIARIMTR